MSGVLTPRMDILPLSQRRLWPKLRAASELGFVLYGGTAIALRLGHRQSVDFDFFTERPLDREAITVALSFVTQATVLQDQRDTLTLLVIDDEQQPTYVKVSFFGSLGFGRVGAPDVTADGVLHVASLADLMATKLKVILQRAEAKDYRDIAAMLNAGESLAHGLAAARQIFGPNFQPSECLKALAYFKDGDLATLSTDEKQTLVDAARNAHALPTVEIRSRALIARQS